MNNYNLCQKPEFSISLREINLTENFLKNAVGGFSFFNKNKENKQLKYEFPAFFLFSDLRNSQENISQIIQMNEGKKKYIYNGKKIVGTTISNENIEQIFILGLTPQNLSNPPSKQAEEIFSLLDKILAENNFNFQDVVRTWFYNNNITEWYADFNSVRTSFFKEKKIFENLVPASTGIGAENIYGSAICAGLHAIKSHNKKRIAQVIESPLQNSAMNYKSSFSRAVEISFPEYKKLYISGTASINKNGETVFIGNCAKQIAETMKIVEALLNSRGATWENVSRSIAYFRKTQDIHFLEEFLKEKKIPQFPIIITQATICRENLLFEIEADAII